MFDESYNERHSEVYEPITPLLPEGTGIHFVVRDDLYLLGANESGKDFLKNSNVLGQENSYITFRQDTWAARFKAASARGENTVLIL